MNKSTLTAIVATALALTLGAHVAAYADESAPAQTGASTATGAHQGRGHLLKELGLTKDELKQIKSIRRGAKTQDVAIKNDASLSDAEKKAKLKELHKATRQQIMDVLTPDQQVKLKQLMAERRAARKDGTAAGGSDE